MPLESAGDNWPASLVNAYSSITDTSFSDPTKFDPGQVASRLAAFEAVYDEVADGLTSIPAELGRLRAEGKQKTVRYKELFSQKLMNDYLMALFERHGIRFLDDN